MSNNKQSVKLYTEEQVKIAIDKSTKFSRYMFEDEKNEVINSLTPIELPSDEEVHNEAFKQTRYSDSFIRGAKWMRDKIGGNK